MVLCIHIILNNKNIKEAIKIVSPYGIDLRSEVESETGKNITLIKNFTNFLWHLRRKNFLHQNSLNWN
ncbi:MAG: hypothetical protein DRQ51_03020 [Gammaproteobacteria bacterium]|nr:MAG: hypothetical protein DRQ51_03020 [Gammaproteobacteria bacterium]